MQVHRVAEEQGHARPNLFARCCHQWPPRDVSRPPWPGQVNMIAYLRIVTAGNPELDDDDAIALWIFSFISSHQYVIYLIFLTKFLLGRIYFTPSQLKRNMKD